VSVLACLGELSRVASASWVGLKSVAFVTGLKEGQSRACLRILIETWPERFTCRNGVAFPTG